MRRTRRCKGGARAKLTTKVKESRKKVKLMKQAEKKVGTLQNKILKLDEKIKKDQAKLDLHLEQLQNENEHLDYYRRQVSYSDLERN